MTALDPTLAGEIASRYDTPFYAYDQALARRQTEGLLSLLPEGSRLLHSFKSNPLPSLAREIRLAGATAEITSLGELEAARLAGHDLSQALYGGPGKAAADLREALDAGVIWFSCESWTDLERLAQTAAGLHLQAQVLLRVNPAEAPDARLAMTGVESQFGFDESLLLEAAAGDRIRALASIRIQGVHIYFGTQVATAAAIAANTRRALETAARLEQALGMTFAVVNAGGGFPWPYATDSAGPDLGGLRETLTELWQTSPLHGRAQLWFEAGRYLCASSGVLVTRVLDVKQSRTRTFVVLDTGIHHLGGMSGLGRIARGTVTFQNLSRSGGEEITADVVGPLCTPLDSLARGMKLPAVQTGDLLAVPNVGAYGLTASLLGFLSHAAPAEITHKAGTLTEAWRWRTGHAALQPAISPQSD